MRFTGFITLLLLLVPFCNAIGQNTEYNITILDSAETFFSKIQKEIRNKEQGTFSDTFYNAAGTIVQITRYTNFTSKESGGHTWTFVDKYLYNQKNMVEKVEHWKTDNTSRMCKCGSWQYKTKGILVLKRPYARCRKPGFDCDSKGEEVSTK